MLISTPVLNNEMFQTRNSQGLPPKDPYDSP